MTSSVIEDRDKLISEYEKLIERLEKAEKWARQMNKTIGKTNISELSAEQVTLGKRYLAMIED